MGMGGVEEGWVVERVDERFLKKIERDEERFFKKNGRTERQERVVWDGGGGRLNGRVDERFSKKVER
jgi:hypothetical protein